MEFNGSSLMLVFLCKKFKEMNEVMKKIKSYLPSV